MPAAWHRGSASRGARDVDHSGVMGMISRRGGGLGFAGWVGLGFCLLLLSSGAGRAETLKEALNAAYKFNPRLDAARAIQRATDEEVPRALSGYRPSVTGSADTGYQLQTTQPAPGTGLPGSTTTETNPRGYQV